MIDPSPVTPPKKVLVIGSGPIVIGQAAEFDYAGTQACRALREEGVQTVLVNSNPATIMTDPGVADVTYVEPLDGRGGRATSSRRERPDGVLATLGGQTGLNLAVALRRGRRPRAVRRRSCSARRLESIKKAEDRELFKQLLLRIGEPVPASVIANTVDEAMAFAATNRLPGDRPAGLHARAAPAAGRPATRPSCVGSRPPASRPARSARCWSSSR